MKTSLATLTCLWLLASSASAQFRDWEQAEDSTPMETEPVAEAEDDVVDDREDRDDAATASDPEEGDDNGAEAGRLIGFAELGFFAGSFDSGVTAQFVDVVALPLLFGAAYQLTRHIGLRARQPLAIASHSDVPMLPGGLALVFANTELSADLRGRVAAIPYVLGAGVTLPFAAASDFGQGVALQTAIGMSGAWDLWLWAPERLAFFVRGRGELELGTDLYLLAQAGLGALLFVGDSIIEDDWMTAQLAASIEYRMETVAVGGRLAGVLASEGALPGRHEAQVSAAPYVRVLFGDSFVRAALTVNLHSPFGFSFGDGKIWGLQVGAGTVLL